MTLTPRASLVTLLALAGQCFAAETTDAEMADAEAADAEIAGAEIAGAESPAAAQITSKEFRQRDEGFILHWQLLRVPELLTRLAFTPFFPLLTVAEQHRFDLRLYDALTNEERTRVVLPLVTAYTKDGVGGGLLYSHSDAFGAGENIEFYALTTTNRDVEVSGSYSEDVAFLDGRSIGLEFEYELDNNERYHGI